MQKFLSFMKKHMGLWRILAIVFALIMMLGFVIGALLEDNSAQVNRKLGTQTSEYAVPEDSGEELYTLYTPDTKYWNTDGTGGGTKALLEDHVAVGTQLSQEGTVLLENDGALPLDSSSAKITLFGVGSSFSGAQYGMAMGGIVEPSQSVSLYEALKDRNADVNADMEAFYDAEASAALSAGYNTVSTSLTDYPGAQTYPIYEASTTDGSKNLTGKKASDYMTGYTGDNSVGIVVLERPSTESGDYYPGAMGVDQSEYSSGSNNNILAPTKAELDEIAYAKQQCSKVIVLINTSNPMELGNIDADAILWIGLPGNYGMYGVADVLLGNANPSGHLADTFAASTISSPAMQNFGIYSYDNAPNYTYAGSYYVVEAEGIYLGYKYYETRYEDSVLGNGNASSSAGAFMGSTWNYDDEVCYSFGYGLSYTTFKQTITSVTFSDYTSKQQNEDETYSTLGTRTAEVTVTVENTGNKAGSSVVQVYGQAPYTEGGVEKASVQLLGYERTPEIAVGGSKDVTVTIDLDLLASYDSETAQSYIMDPGTYYFALGCNNDADNPKEGAHAAINNILTKKGYSTSDENSKMDYDGSEDAVYQFTWYANTSSDGYKEGDAWGNPFTESRAGVDVTNQLETADLNYYKPNTVVYLSRSDWEWTGGNGKGSSESGWDTSTTAWNGTSVTDYTGATNLVSSIGYTGVDAAGDIQKQLMNETYTGDNKDALTTYTYDYDTDLTFNADNNLTFYDVLDIDEQGNVSVKDYNDETWTKLMEELDLQEGLIFIAQGNRTYSALSGINFVGGTLTENGPVGLDVTLGGVSVPWADNDNNGYHLGDVGCATLQAAAFDKELLESIGEVWGNDSLYAQIPVLWAPSLNIHRTPYNGRSAEYYSEDACVSGYSALSIVNGLNTYGFLGTIKHFALNDQESNRNGLSVYVTEQQARENELRGFQIAFEGGALATMTSFNRIGATYSGASGAMSGILRGEWQFKGYAVSDYWFWPLYMRISESVLAGTTNFDALDYTKWGDQTLASSYANDDTMKAAIKTSVHEALYAFAHSNMMNYMTPHAYVVRLNNWWRSTYTALEIVGGIVAGLAFVAFVIGAVDGLLTKKED